MLRSADALLYCPRCKVHKQQLMARKQHQCQFLSCNGIQCGCRKRNMHNCSSKLSMRRKRHSSSDGENCKIKVVLQKSDIFQIRLTIVAIKVLISTMMLPVRMAGTWKESKRKPASPAAVAKNFRNLRRFVDFYKLY